MEVYLVKFELYWWWVGFVRVGWLGLVRLGLVKIGKVFKEWID